MLSPAAVRADMADMDDLMTSICSPVRGGTAAALPAAPERPGAHRALRAQEPFGDHLISFPDLGNELPSEAKARPPLTLQRRPAAPPRLRGATRGTRRRAS